MSADDHTLDPGLDNLDFVLGEMDADAARAHERRMAEDPELARQASEIRTLIQDLRDLDTEPSNTIPLRLRYALARRLSLRQPFSPRAVITGVRQVLFHGLQVAAVALVVCCGLLYVESRLAPLTPVAEPVEVVGVPPLQQPALPIADDPVLPAEGTAEIPPCVRTDPDFRLWFDKFAKGQPVSVSDFEGFVDATNELSTLRREFRVRVSPRQRRQAIRKGGSSTSLDGRIQDLAVEIAAKIDDRLAAGEASVVDVTLAVRALLAAGSHPDAGPHGDTVRRCAVYLENRVADLEGWQLASALAGLMDLAVVSGRCMERLVGEHADRLAWSVSAAEGPERPSLLHWQTPAASLADAGVVLRLAPAFGVNVMRAGRARLLLAAHVQERIASTRNERPDLVAAQLYGFGDLVDRRELDHKLLLWEPQDLVPGHFVALHHVSWSQFPTRRGWARFQQGLRTVAVRETPPAVGDASALLLALAMNYAAPGSSEIVALAMGAPSE
ncbi:MAG: anti-sigma factor family protein [Planctomycetota bacterium]|jgi:hypothetical protein